MRRDPDLPPEPAGGLRGRLSSEWAAFRARVPYLLRRLIITVLVLFVVCAIPWTYFNIKYSNEVARELARLRAEGEPLTIEELIPEPVPDDQNAPMIYQPLFGVSWEPFRASPDGGIVGMIPPDQYQRLIDGLGYDATFDVELAREVLTRPEVIAVMASLEEASRRPYAVWPIPWEGGFAVLFPHLAQYRHAARLCAARTRLSAVDGDIDDALRWVGVSLRMSRHVISEPTVIGQLVGIAINTIALRSAEQALDAGVSSPEAVEALGELASGFDMNASFHRAMQMERAMGLEAFRPGYADSVATTASLGGGDVDLHNRALAKAYDHPLGAPLRALDQARMLANWRAMMPELDKPWRLQDRGAIEARLQNESRLAILTMALLPGLARTSMRRDQGIAMLDELRIVLDLKMHKRLHGVYPATLDDLGRELPEDPFSGEAFRYEQRGEGFALWSIGPDLEDDGGIPPEPESDLGWDEADIVWECEG